MNKSFPSLLAFVMLGAVAAVAATNSRAAVIQDDDYVRIVVPDMAQAATFFRDVLDCQLISPRLDSGDSHQGSRESRLLSCGAGSVIELSAAPSPATSAGSQHREPIRLISDDVAGAAQWLRHEGVRVLGTPRTLKSGQTVVNFIAPWGLRLQLVSWKTNVTTAGP